MMVTRAPPRSIVGAATPPLRLASTYRSVAASYEKRRNRDVPELPREKKACSVLDPSSQNVRRRRLRRLGERHGLRRATEVSHSHHSDELAAVGDAVGMNPSQRCRPAFHR